MLFFFSDLFLDVESSSDRLYHHFGDTLYIQWISTATSFVIDCEPEIGLNNHNILYYTVLFIFDKLNRFFLFSMEILNSREFIYSLPFLFIFYFIFGTFLYIDLIFPIYKIFSDEKTRIIFSETIMERNVSNFSCYLPFKCYLNSLGVQQYVPPEVHQRRQPTFFHLNLTTQTEKRYFRQIHRRY